MRTQVKICGLTRPVDIESALRYGADALGFIVEAPSPRRLSVDIAVRLSAPAKGLAKRVAVTVNADDDLIKRIQDEMQPESLQLHGSETPKRVEAIKALGGFDLIKAVPIQRQGDLDTIQAYAGLVDYILLDAKPPKGDRVRGGHGQSFDWALLKGFQSKTPFILAGGIGIHNIGAAQKTGIDFFDLSSGVEQAQGVKDPLKIKALMDNLV